MQNKLIWRFAIIATVVGFLGVKAYDGINGGLELGIDLEGGSEIIFRFDFGNHPPAQRALLLQQSIGIVQERVDGYGLKEIRLQPIGNDRFSVEIPAKEKKNVDAIKDLIAVLGKLELRITVEPGEQNYEAYWRQFQTALSKGVSLEQARVVRPDQLLDGDANRYPLGLRWYPLSDRAKGPPNKGGYQTARLPQGDAGPEPWVLCRMDNYQLSGDSLKNVVQRRETQGLSGGWVVVFEVKKAHQANMARLTATKGEHMAIVLNDDIDSAPILKDAPLSNRASISGNFSEEEARGLAAVLQAGALQEKPELIAERTVAADLAGGARDRGLLSIAVGFLLVLLIMVWLYKGPGLLANLALLLNLVLLLGVLTWFDAVLTLPGLAGVVLTVGMAVDANILVFERIKEEKSKGRTVAQAVMTGYDRALVTIIDSNLTTLITAYFLFQIGSGPVRGFGITLAVGIVASMFTALYVTRTLFTFLLAKGVVKDADMRGEFSPPSVNWMAKARRAVTISAVSMVTGVVLYVAVPENKKYDLDFTKGSKLIVRFHEEMDLDEIHAALAELGDRNDLYKEISVRISAEGIGASVTGDRSKGFELRSQRIASREDIDAFKADFRAKFEKKLVPGPFEATIREGAAGRSTGTIYFLSDRVRAPLLREAFRQYHEAKGPLGAPSVEPVKGPTPGAGSAFTVGFSDPATKAGEIAINVRNAFKGYDHDLALVHLEDRTTDDDATEAEQREAAAVLEALKGLGSAPDEDFFEETDPFPLADRIDPSTAQEHRNAAVKAVALSIIGIIVYVAFRFRSWVFGFAAVVALVHDVLVVMGVVALVNLFGVVDARLNLVTVAAFLTLIGYSINDTIVVFDRIRENRGSGKSRLHGTIDKSINQTFARTIRTTTTTWIVVVLLFIMNYGQNSALEGFAFILTVGVLVGTYSSIFIASPTLLYLPWLWEQCGRTVRGLFLKSLPYVIAGFAFLTGIDVVEGRFGTDPSLGIFNDILLSIPIGTMAYFLVNFLRFLAKDRQAAAAAKTSA